MNEKLLDGRTVAILVSNGFDEVEFTDPQKRLIELGATVKVVSRVKNLVNGWYEGNWGHFFPCLLYTSPSPRDRTRSRMPSSA